MRRETVNKIRYVLEEWLPPVVRDSSLMRVLFRMHWGTFIDDLEKFRRDITQCSDEQYRSIYERMPRIQEQTDNSEACIDKIAARTLAGQICDVGCGTGYLLKVLSGVPALRGSKFTGVDFIIEPSLVTRHPGITFVPAPIERLPFPDQHFDTVVCTHVLEHVLDIRTAIGELRRICARRLIVVVPREREHTFTFNPHIHFFPYPSSFLRYIIPVPATHHLEVVGRDILYVEERNPSSA